MIFNLFYTIKLFDVLSLNNLFIKTKFEHVDFVHEGKKSYGCNNYGAGFADTPD